MDGFVSWDTYVKLDGHTGASLPRLQRVLYLKINFMKEEERDACPYKSGDQSVHITITRQDVAAGCTGDPMDGFDCAV